MIGSPCKAPQSRSIPLYFPYSCTYMSGHLPAYLSNTGKSAIREESILLGKRVARTRERETSRTQSQTLISSVSSLTCCGTLLTHRPQSQPRYLLGKPSCSPNTLTLLSSLYSRPRWWMKRRRSYDRGELDRRC
jgi:hypothetical protein